MKEHIIRAILYQDMSVKWKDAELKGDVNIHLNVHQKTRQFVEVELDDFLLSDGEAILASFEKTIDGEIYHENPAKMGSVDGEKNVYRLQIPTLVHNTPGEWDIQFYIVTDYDIVTGEYTNSYPSDIAKFSEYSSIHDDGLEAPTKDGMKELYRVAAGLNLENGEGAGSLKQKSFVIDGQTVEGASVTGAGSVAFGGRRFDKPEGAVTTVTAKQAFTTGGGHTVGNNPDIAPDGVGGDFTATFGTDNINQGEKTIVAGNKNKVYQTVKDDGAILTPNSAAVFGQLNELYGSSASFVAGYNNVVKSPYTFVVGWKNIATADIASILGDSNVSNGSSSLTAGRRNVNNGSTGTVLGLRNANNPDDESGNGDSALVSGMDNTNKGRWNGVIGYHCENTGGYANCCIGYWLQQKWYSAGEFITGKYNEVKKGLMFSVGNGTADDARSNAFEVLTDGRAKVYGAPTEDNDVVRKMDLADTATTADLDTKLDKVTTTGGVSQIYGVRWTGEQRMIDFTGPFPDEGAIPSYDVGGCLVTNEPNKGQHATNKIYVDNAVASVKKYYRHHISFGHSGADGELLDKAFGSNMVVISSKSTALTLDEFIDIVNGERHALTYESPTEVSVCFVSFSGSNIEILHANGAYSYLAYTDEYFVFDDANIREI